MRDVALLLSLARLQFLYFFIFLLLKSFLYVLSLETCCSITLIRLASLAIANLSNLSKMANVEQKNPERVAAGLKATLHNPTVSAEAKSRAQARLKEMGVDAETKTPSHKAKEETKTTDEAQPHDLRHEEAHGYEMPEEQRILGGYKATLKNPNVSQEAKEHAKEVLKEHEAM